jgi:23S rRNA (guanosine2251-2'-O)-methyltransferase
MLLEKVDQPFKIPMRGQTDSFNVSVATGIILYEVLRQQLGSKS